MPVPSEPLILVIGATGYVGGQLVPLLLRAGYRVRCLVRHPDSMKAQSWMKKGGPWEVVAGDVLRPETLSSAMQGVSVVYYFVHSMGTGVDFARRDIAAARNCAEAAKEQGVERIIYLGGLGDPAAPLSKHLRSRQDTGDALREAGVPVTEFRAAVVIGSGSLSFELVRYLTERVPLMICPYWVYTRIQPIAVRNVLEYLVTALTQPLSVGKIIEIGGQDVLTYGGMMKTYAAARSLRRFLIPVPVLTPRLSSYWVNLVTPIPVEIAQPLIEGLRNEVIVRDDAARVLFPEIELLDCRSAIEEALREGERELLARSLEPAAPGARTMTLMEGMYREQRHCRVDAASAQMYAALNRLGGENGWPTLNWAWQLRGLVDKLCGGVGMRRSRNVTLHAGYTLDFWRVEVAQPNSLLRLRAEMKVPGKAWLQFHITPYADGTCELTQTALFVSKGLFGVLYWYALYPVHCWIFRRMLQRLATFAE